MASHQSTVMDVRTNVFCASGMHLPNGSYVTFGGNGAVGPLGKLGSSLNPGGFSANWDATIQDFDGTRGMRILNPCRNSDDMTSPQCQWFDDPTVLSMQHSRWYSAAEATADGNVVIIGGFVNGGYVNRNWPNVDPVTEGLAADSTYEYYPPRPATPQQFDFLVHTSGLNAYVHTFLMPSGKMFVQGNTSSVLWDHEANVETPLPDMPNGVVRVYPASGATAMLPLTPANNYTPTILFCGGSNMPDFAWGNYSFPFIDTWNYPASQDCQRITPEPQDGSPPVYIKDDDLIEGRTMGQFITLPNGKMLVVNGGLNGTAGYSDQGTLTTPAAQMPFTESLASGPVLTPAIYDPNGTPGSRWSNAGLSASTIPRLYHSSAILLPDASVLIAGSNPNIDVNTNAFFPTTYKAEIFYPPYFSAAVRPAPTGVPSTLSYGGNSFDITIPQSSYGGQANDAADSATVVVIRGGFTTHAMNMGQRFLQLNNTYTVNSDGTITLHVAQLPPNANLFQPGPAFLFVNIAGVPSNGTYVIVGNGQIGTQPVTAASVLPPNIRASNVAGTASTASGAQTTGTTTSGAKKTSVGLIVGAAAGGLAVLALVGGLILVMRRRRARAGGLSSSNYPLASSASIGAGAYARTRGEQAMEMDSRERTTWTSETSAFQPLQHTNHSQAWNSTTSLQAPYSDNFADGPRANTPGLSGPPMRTDDYAPRMQRY
jgi:hypothetical protein